MEKSIGHLESALLHIRTGKASPVMLDSVKAMAYGSPMPLNQLANVSAPDTKTIVVQPWDKSLIPVIHKAILEANIGLNPQNDGDIIRLPVPPLTEERRKELVKQAKTEGEKTKVSIRNIRRDHNEKIKKLTGAPEDLVKKSEAEIQKLTDSFIAKVDTHLKDKEAEIMKV